MRCPQWFTLALALGIPALTASTCTAQQKPTVRRETVRVADRDMRREVKVDAASSAPPAVEYTGDPYGFIAILNSYRASVGLHPVAFDANLSAWASHNNAAQCGRGIGHYVTPNCFQNSAWNCTSATEVAQAWMNSRGHRANMLSPSITRVGIAYGPGPYWTMNAQ